MDPTRIVCAGLLVMATLVLGCTRPQPPPAGAKPGAPAAGGDSKSDPALFAKSFLMAVHEGTATPAMLSTEFKKVVAEPVFLSDQGQAYSDDAAEEWLKRFKGNVANPLTGTTGAGDAHILTGAAGTPPRRLALRVVRAGNDWKADWFSATPITPATSAIPGGESAYPAFAAVAFLDALLAKDDRLAEGLMTPAFKAKLAPPLPSDRRGYNRGSLSTKLSEVRGSATGYALGTVNGSIVAAELIAPPGKKSVTLKLVKGDRPWDWLVDEIKAE